MTTGTWTVVVPVKHLSVAKSRLRGALADVPHEVLALALARDTVRAVLACPTVREVVVVTGDSQAATVLGELGARLVPDPGAGLNAAFTYGAATAGGRPVAALTADLPSLRPSDLAAALAVAAAGPSGVRHFVADAPGTGTVLLTAGPGTPLHPGFGTGSAAAHVGSGARALTGDWPSLRRDVDTAADLADAAVLGLGPATSALVRATGAPFSADTGATTG